MVTSWQVIADRYEITALISSGGMGQVWRGYDTVLDRDIVVKLIKPEIADSPDREELIGRFRREARVTAKIEHHGVPAVFDAAFDAAFDEAADRLYIVMQFVRGIALADLFHEHDTMRFPRFSGHFWTWFDRADQKGSVWCQHRGSTRMSCGNGPCGCIASRSRSHRFGAWPSS